MGTVAAMLIGGVLAGTVSTAAEKGPALTIGQAAPTFSLQDQNGKTINLSDYSWKIVVLEWFNNSCPYVQKFYNGGAMNTLAKKYEEKGVVWLAVNSTKERSVSDNKAISEKWSINRPILSDASGATGRAYGAKTTPNMYIIDKAGNLAYQGAIDSIPTDEPADIEKATNYVAQALDELLEGKPVSKAETKPYGCSVKYAK
jgi:peroxiredoxin